MKIGAEELVLQPETKRALDIEIMLLNIPLFAAIFTYAYGYIAWPVFYLLFHIFEMRIFISNHDRFHTDASTRLPRPLEFVAEWLAASVTPWDEPYDSVRRKHILHHSTHLPGKAGSDDPAKDPHAVYEMGGFWRALLGSIFYEEIQLYLDIRNKKLAKSRILRLVIYLPLQILFISAFGWTKFLGVFVAMRIVGFMGWFVFSWGIHQPVVFRFGFSKDVPAGLKWMFLLMNGKRVTEGCLHHATHHAWPTIPTYKLRDFDAAVLRNPDAMPEMIPTRG